MAARPGLTQEAAAQFKIRSQIPKRPPWWRIILYDIGLEVPARLQGLPSGGEVVFRRLIGLCGLHPPDRVLSKRDIHVDRCLGQHRQQDSDWCGCYYVACPP